MDFQDVPRLKTVAMRLPQPPSEASVGLPSDMPKVLLVLTLSGACLAQAVHADVLLHWVPFLHVPGVVDLTGPRRDGSLTVTAGGQLFLLQPSGALHGFAHGPG